MSIESGLDSSPPYLLHLSVDARGWSWYFLYHNELTEVAALVLLASEQQTCFGGFNIAHVYVRGFNKDNVTAALICGTSRCTM